MHNDNSENNNENNSPVVRSVINNSHCDPVSEVRFKIAPITVYGKTKNIKTYAFIDEGSSISLIDEQLIEDLELSGTVNPLCLKWTGGVERCGNNPQRVTIHISGENNKKIAINVCTVSSFNRPTQTLNYENMANRFPHLRNLPIKAIVMRCQNYYWP